MKKLIVLTLFTLIFYNTAEAKIRLPYCSGCQYVEEVAELPDSAAFYSEEYKSYADVGYIYNQFWILWLPIWNYDGKYVLSIKDQDVFFDVAPEELETYKKAYNLDLPENPISIWNKLGGKVIIGLVLALAAWGLIDKKQPDGKKEEFFTAKG